VEPSNLLLTHPAREELLPGPVAHGLLESQVSAGPDCAGRLAWQRERHDEAVSVTSPQVAAEKLFHLVHAWPGDVGYEAGRLAEGELDEPGRHFTAVDRLEPDAGQNRYHRHLRHLPSHFQHRVVKLGGAQGSPVHPTGAGKRSGRTRDGPRGQLFLVLGFTITDGRITEIDVVADPARLRQLDLAVLDG
jgi:hypothetical protein